MATFTSITEVDRIAGMTNPAERNHQISQSYHELSAWLNTRIGPCANWCTFATWASRQAGQTIRQEDLLQALENHLTHAPELGQAVYELAEILMAKGARMSKNGITQVIRELADPRVAMLRASAAVGRGNQKVYAEIAREFARFMEVCGKDEHYDTASIDAFCDPLRPGDPPDGQGCLKQAFRHYYEAFFEPNDKKKAELVLLANILIGFHEQTRLQPEIAEAMEASVADPREIKAKLQPLLFSRQSGWMTALLSFSKSLFGIADPLDIALEKFAAEARRRIRRFLSAHLMELGFPDGVRLRLGQDLKAAYPPNLQTLNHPDLLSLLSRIDPTPDSLRDTAALDWARLEDRLHFIVDLFRCYQEERGLWE